MLLGTAWRLGAGPSGHSPAGYWEIVLQSAPSHREFELFTVSGRLYTHTPDWLTSHEIVSQLSPQIKSRGIDWFQRRVFTSVPFSLASRVPEIWKFSASECISVRLAISIIQPSRPIS